MNIENPDINPEQEPEHEHGQKHERGIHVLMLPEDQSRVEELKAKLAEYEVRLEARIEQNPYKPLSENHSLRYKIAVLSKLLEDGQLNLGTFSEDLISKEGEDFNINALKNAVAVINDYVETGGKKARGGTGLKSEEKKS